MCGQQSADDTGGDAEGPDLPAVVPRQPPNIKNETSSPSESNPYEGTESCLRFLTQSSPWNAHEDRDSQRKTCPPSQSQNHSHIRLRASWVVRSTGCSGVPVGRFTARRGIGLYQAPFLCSRELAQYQRISRVHRELSWPLHPRQAGQRHPSLVYLKPVLELLYRARIIFHAPNLQVVACLVKGISNSFS